LDGSGWDATRASLHERTGTLSRGSIAQLQLDDREATMIDLQVRIGRTNEPNYGPETLARTEATWQEVQEFFADPRAVPFLLEQAPDRWYELAIDASGMLEYLHKAIGRAEAWFTEMEEVRRTGEYLTEDPGLMPTIEPFVHLRITPRGAARTDEPPLWIAGRFLEQLFLAMNIATPGSCNLAPCEYPDHPDPPFPPPRLNANVLDDALFDALSMEEGWPRLRRIPFHATWEWLHRDLAYHIEAATSPTQKAFFGLMRICTRQQEDPDNILVLSQAIEALLDPGRKSIQRVLGQRLRLLIGSSPSHPEWFNRFYQLRSRIIHGSAPVLRPGGQRAFLEDAGAREIAEEAASLEGMAVAALLTLLQDMVIHNVRRYRFEQQLIRESW
jgi:hypothetical protein